MIVLFFLVNFPSPLCIMVTILSLALLSQMLANHSTTCGVLVGASTLNVVAEIKLNMKDPSRLVDLFRPPIIAKALFFEHKGNKRQNI